MKSANQIALLQELRDVIKSHSPLESVVAVLARFKEHGGAQNDALQVIEQLRAEAPDEATEDFILEIMDIATNFCSLHLRVWD